jgi:hypothetical protein
MFPVQLGRSISRLLKCALCCCTFLLALTLPFSVHAQEGAGGPYPQEVAASAAPAHIGIIEGAATLEHDGQSQPVAVNALFVPGDHLRTGAGRVEVLFPDGSALDVDQYSAVDLQAPALIRLASGRLILVVSGVSNPASAARYQIDTPVASARTDGPGEYRVAVLNGRNGVETELAVLRGTASLATERGAVPVRAGERSVARDADAPTYPQTFNSARFDDFDRWAAARHDERTGRVSPNYLPQDLQMYGGTFDRYGSWENTAPYGEVWYPTVAPDWRPYYYGYWAPYQPWGWTWIGVDSWAWPTHHFGRWGFARSRWFWIPGRTWSPAWVAWAGAPGFVSWCPLGFNERPVFGFSLGFASRWSGWTVVPRTSFGGFARADRFAVEPHRVPPSTAFVVQRVAPVAVPRSAHAQNVTVPPASGAAVPRVNPGGVRPQGNTSVQSSLGTSDMRAVPRLPAVTAPPASAMTARPAPAVTAPPAAHEFKRPLPDGYRAPSAGAPSYAVPRTGTPSRGGVYVVGPHVGTAAPQAVPQAVPRSTPQAPAPAPVRPSYQRSYPSYPPASPGPSPAHNAPAPAPAWPAHVPSMATPRIAPPQNAVPSPAPSHSGPSGMSHAAPSAGPHSAPSGGSHTAPSSGGSHAAQSGTASSGGGHRR